MGYRRRFNLAITMKVLSCHASDFLRHGIVNEWLRACARQDQLASDGMSDDMFEPAYHAVVPRKVGGDTARIDGIRRDASVPEPFRPVRKRT
jgi:hypothetical protein